MYEIIGIAVAALAALFGISYGVKQKQKAKEADARNEGLVDAYDDMVERQTATVKEVKDVADSSKDIVKERKDAESDPVRSDSVGSRLERLRK